MNDMSSPSLCAEELSRLAAEVARMGGLAETQVVDAVEGLIRRDSVQASALIERDLHLDAQQVDIERRAIALIGRYGPEGADLRRAVSAMKMAGNLERCGDLARNIAKRSLILSPVEPKGIMRALERMGRIAAGRLSDVVDAYVGREVEQALSIWRRDEEIDDHYESLFAELLELMRRDPASVGDGAHLLFIAKNLERIGDHATNIAEVVYFEATGLDLTVERPKWSLPDAVVTDS
jgi:phosphate transport system protein